MFPNIPALPTQQKISEDSLWLNVFAPEQGEEKKEKVGFWDRLNALKEKFCLVLSYRYFSS
jgi:carboxylesterase type B